MSDGDTPNAGNTVVEHTLQSEEEPGEESKQTPQQTKTAIVPADGDVLLRCCEHAKKLHQANRNEKEQPGKAMTAGVSNDGNQNSANAEEPHRQPHMAATSNNKLQGSGADNVKHLSKNNRSAASNDD